jgi:hypothetical protein
MSFSIASTAICHRNDSILQLAWRTGGGRHWHGEILQDNNVLVDVLSTLRVGDTLIPLIFMSNGTHISNYGGDIEEWSGYMTISNVSSMIRQMPSMHCIIVVALLSIEIKNCNIPQEQLHKQQQTNYEVLIEVLCQ